MSAQDISLGDFSSGGYIDPTYLDPSSADLSTEYANPSLNNNSGTSWSDALSQVGNIAGQWGTTIASVVTGHPVSSVVTPTGGVQPIGAAGSYVARPSALSGNSGLLLLLAVGIVVFLLLQERS